MTVKVHVYTCFHIALIKSTAGNKTRLFMSPFLISISRSFVLAQAFRNDHVAVCSTTLRSAAGKIEMGGYLTVPYPSKVKQHSSTADWLKF